MERNGHSTAVMPHQLIMQDRKRMELSGVTDVDSFDEGVIFVSTSLGVLAIHGDGLHVRQLSLENGNLSIEGHIQSLSYSEKQKSGFFGRLFR